MKVKSQRSRSNPLNVEVKYLKNSIRGRKYPNWQSILRIVVLNIYQKTLKLNQKNIDLKKEYIIGSTAQKKTNQITKFLINAFLWNVASTLIKMH